MLAKQSTLWVTAFLFCNSLLFGSLTREIVDINPQHLFVPSGFDDNDQVEIITDGYLPDTCYRIRPTQVFIDLDKKRITVQPKAQLFPGVCMDVTVPFTTVVPISAGVPTGNYEITTKNGSLKERLFVAPAPFSSPDDYLYAPVDKATVENTMQGTQTATVYGRFTNSCSMIDNIKITVTDKTIQVLPVMKQSDKDQHGNPCAAEERPFEERITLPKLATGRYLLHVRSLNGQSVNQVFNSQN